MKPVVTLAAVLLGALLALAPARAEEFVDRPAAPEFTRTDAEGWINTAPLSLAALRGHVVLVDVWAFDCWNCYRSFPWLKLVEARYHDAGLRVVGVHTPEFEHERDRAQVAAKVAEFGLDHPVMLDDDYAYWRALGNRYWPTYYLVDREGRLRARFVGETRAGSGRALRVESAVKKLLAE